MLQRDGHRRSPSPPLRTRGGQGEWLAHANGTPPNPLLYKEGETPSPPLRIRGGQGECRGRSSFLSPIPHPLSPRRSGFTLVEVLAALAVLIIGMSAILGVLYATYQNSHTAADRDAAGILLPAALRDIAQQQYVYATGTYTEAATPTLFPAATSPLLAKYQQAGALYRMRYRLEARSSLPDYTAEYEGLYVLTVVCYRDAKKDASQLIQIADPVTVYLRKR